MLSSAAAYLEALAATPPPPYRERLPPAQRAVGRLLECVGHPERGLPIVHIAGSKGKGSVALMVESILRAAGLRVGTYLSPHLQDWRERFRLAGQAVTEECLVVALAGLRPYVQAWEAENSVAAGFFDVATAAALWLFQQARVEVAVIEAGLGGRLDATNVVSPRVSCITAVELEHTDKLGADLTAIAREKAGIIKPGAPLVMGALPVAAAREVSARAQALDVPLWRWGSDIRTAIVSEEAAGLTVICEVGDGRYDVFLPVLGAHQAHNAALAIACVRALGVIPHAALGAAVQQGFARLRLPGRCEILSREPYLVVDSAHTLDSAAVLRKALEQLQARRVHWVLSFARDKNVGGLGAAFVAPGDILTLTQADARRSLAPEVIAAALRAQRPPIDACIVREPGAALRAAYQGLAAADLLCVSGSVYMAGWGRTVFGAHPE